jgi:hypothetical protein
MRLPKSLYLLIAAVMAILGVSTGAFAAPVHHAPARRATAHAASGQDWTRSVRVVAGGGHLLGNPAARAKLVEFISYTCPHCAHFNQETRGPLRDGYVRPGRVSVEVRSLVRDPIDLTAAMLVNCGDPARFVGNHDLFLATQDRWFAALEKSTDAQRQRWGAGALPDRLKAIATDFGFYPMMASRGYARPQVDACLADKAMLGRLVAQTDAASKAGVNSTPSFLLNGALLDAHDWASVEPLVKAAL